MCIRVSLVAFWRFLFSFFFVFPELAKCPVAVPVLENRRHMPQRKTCAWWIALGALLCVAAGAQTAQFSGYESTVPVVGTNPVQIAAVAVDANGNVYVSDLGNDQVVELKPATGGGYQPQIPVANAAAGGLGAPQGLALDTGGNVYIANNANKQILKVACASTCGTPSVLVSGLSKGPQALAFDPYGYIWFTMAGDSHVWSVSTSGGAPVNYSSTYFTSSTFTQPTGLAWQITGGGPGTWTGNLFIADYVLNTVVEWTWNGSAWVFGGTVPTSGLSNPTGLAANSAGSLYVADYSNDRVIEVPWDSTLSMWGTQLTLPTSSLNHPGGVAIDAGGNIYIADLMNHRAVKETVTGVNFGSLPINTASSSFVLPFTFETAGTLGSTAVLTQGSPGLDFADAGTGSCSTGHAYNAGDVCTIAVTFTPRSAGMRYGTAVLKDGSGNAFATAHLYGTGTGPQVVFEPGAESTLPVSGTLTPIPYALAVDGAGNVFVSDGANNLVVKETISGSSYVQSTVATGFAGARGVAVDGAGNIYVADYAGQQLYKVPWDGSAYGAKQLLLPAATYWPAGLIVDGSGNVYFTNFAPAPDGNVYEISGSGVTTLPNVTGLTQALGLALDSNGNLFISDYLGNHIVELPWTTGGWGTQIPALATGLLHPARIAVDAAESIYVADSDNNHVVRAPSTGCNTWGGLLVEPTSTLASPQAVALDSAGNLFIADSSNHRVLKLDRADAPSLNFADTPATWPSSDSPKTVQAENIGNQNLNFTLPSPDPNYPSDFPVNSADTNLCASGTPLLPGATCDLSMSFIPTYERSFTEDLALTDDNLNAVGPGWSVQNIHLAGKGTPQPMAFVAPDNAHFSDTVQGTTANAWTFTLNNTSNLELIGISMSFTGANPSNFAIAGSSCGATLPPYSTCTFEVTFTPTITEDASDYYSANLVVNDDAVGHPQVIPLSGNGIGMAVLLNPNPVDFGTQTAGGTSSPQTAIMANANSGTLTIYGIGLTGAQAGAFNIIATTCGPLPIPGGGVTLGPNQSCTITTNFTPSSNSYYSATLSVWDNGTGAPHTISVQGQGQGQTVMLAPTSMNFADQTAGSTGNAWTATFNNTSDQPVTGVAVSIVGANPADFAQTNNCPSTVPAHTTCNIWVIFTPQSVAYFQATLQVVGSAGTQTAFLDGTGTGATATLAPNQLNFGSVPQNVTSPAQPATLTNNSGGPLTITGVSITSNSAEYAITSNGCGATLAAHATCQIWVAYTPHAAGDSTGTLTVNDSAIGSPQTVSLVGVGTSTSVTGFLSPGSINFGNQTVGSTSNAWGMTLNNTSSTAMTGLSIVMGGSNAGDFIQTSNCGATLAANSTCNISVEFRPTATGGRSATLIAAYTAGSGGTFTAGLSGTGVAPTVALAPNSLNFGNQTAGIASSPQNATLTNTSSGPITITNVSISSGAPTFSLGANTCGGSLAAYSSCSIGVIFTPPAAGNFTGTLIIDDSASGGQQSLALGGTGSSNTPSGYFSPNAISFGNQTVGSTSNAWGVTINNNSNVAMSGVAITVSDPVNFTVTPACNAPLAANSSCYFEVRFNPSATSLGAQAATLVATFTGGSGGTVTAPLTGYGIPATVAVAPGSINFGNVAFGSQSGDQTVTLSNTSAGVLSNISVVPSGGSFFVDGPASNCGTSLAAYTSCTIAVYFKPATATSLNGMLTFYDNASGGQQTVSLSGNGQLGPQTITFAPLACPTNFAPGASCTLSATASSSLAVSFSVLSGPGSISGGNSLNIGGAGTIVVAANQGGDSDYSAAPQVTHDLVVAKGTAPGIVWPAASSIAYGQALSASTLSGGSGPGTFAWTDTTIMPPVGTSPESVTFTPTATADYNTVTNTVSVAVTKATPSVGVVCYNDPIMWLPGSAQTATCTADVGSGATGTVTFYWKLAGSPTNNVWGTVALAGGSASLTGFNGLSAGTYTVEVDYAGDASYNTAIATTTETILKATPSTALICAPNPITYLAGASQTATCTATVGAGATGNVTFYWKPLGSPTKNLWNTVPLSGGRASLTGFNGLTASTYELEADYLGDENNNATSATSTEVINQATPAVTTWPTASGITTGQALSASTLSGGVASVAGTFVWTAPSTVPPSGTYSSTGDVTFMPADATDYSSVAGTVPVVVTDPGHSIISASTFTLAANPPTLTVQAGQSGTLTLSLIPLNGFAGTVGLACSGLPSGIACSFSPSSLTADGHGTIQTSHLTVSAVGFSASAASRQNRSGGKTLAGILMLPGFFFGGLLAWRRKKLSGWAKQMLVIGMLASTLAGFAGCGGGGGSHFTNPLAGTRTITVAAQASPSGGSTTTDTGTFTLTVTQ